MKRISLFFLSLTLLFSLAGCSASPERAPEKLQIVTTLFPYYDFARAVAGDCADVTLLVAAGKEAHSFEPTPLDAVTISEADVFLYNGGESEVWVSEMLGAVGEDVGTIVCMIDYVDAIEEEFVPGMQDGETHEHSGAEEQEEHESEAEYDEHIWTSPRNAAALCWAICDALCEADAGHADQYEENCAAYCTELEVLDQQLRELREAAVRDTLVFADRFPLLYFCREYDLNYYAAFHGCSTDTEPSLATLKFLIDLVREQAIPVVYTVDLSSQKIAEAVSECTGARIERLWSLQTVSREDFAQGETYVSLMQRNIKALKEGLL